MQYPNEFTFLKKIYRMFLIFPFTTVLCESSFSHMNQIKTKYRTEMLSETLSDLMWLVLYPKYKFDFRTLAFDLAGTWVYETQ